MRHGAAEQPGAEEARAPELTVATNSPGVASALADLPLVELFVLGGRYVRDLGTCVGGDTLAAVAQLGADLFFLGSCGLDALAWRHRLRFGGSGGQARYGQE
ncbi:hypothetical protein P9228_18390 [Mesorhizobium sp. WSM4898]|nr:hypothetical protein [Mesorhizobium sp. WSM4898]MDG4908399.1 hypothetical protein [Mesorhizobium sp. WSM4898]